MFFLFLIATLAGLVELFYPESIYNFREMMNHRSSVEPSTDYHIFMIRLSGGIMVVIGIINLIIRICN